MLHLHFSVVRPKSTRTSPYGAPRKLAGTAQFPESKDKLSRRSIAGTDEDDPRPPSERLTRIGAQCPESGAQTSPF